MAILTKGPIMRWMIVPALFFVVSVLVAAMGYAQEAAAPQSEPIWKALLDMAMKSLVPALWVAAGPVAVAAITKSVNKLSTAYVPRSLQVVLSGVVTAVLAGLTGDVSGAVSAAGTGMGAQVLAATPPEKLLTSERES